MESEGPFSFLKQAFSGKVSSPGISSFSFSWTKGGPGILPQYPEMAFWSPFLLLPSAAPHTDRKEDPRKPGPTDDHPKRGFFFSAPPISTWHMVWHRAGGLINGQMTELTPPFSRNLFFL